MTWTLHPIASFAALQTEWDALQARSTAVPFLSSAFLTPLLATYGNGQERIAVQQGASGWQAAALVRPEGRARWELFQPSQLPQPGLPTFRAVTRQKQQWTSLKR